MKFEKNIVDVNQQILNNLNSVDIVNLYQYVVEYEVNIKGFPGSFDISDKNVDKFLNKNGIYLDTCAKKNFPKAKKSQYYFLFEQYKKSKASGDDKAHHLMRHIRNSVAHGKVEKISGKPDLYKLTDFSVTTGRETMWAQISVPFLYQLIEKLIESKK